MASATENPVHDWLTKPIPETLWHYTSLQGFLSIVASKHIFATDMRYLNDREEFVHAQAFVDQVISELDEIDENGWGGRQAAKTFTEGLFTRGVLSPKYSQVFVASFSTAEDQLSQWRAYSRGSTGVSLGFDLRNIRPDPGSDALSLFGQCIYQDGMKREFISHSIKTFVQGASAIWKQAGDQNQNHELLQNWTVLSSKYSSRSDLL
jgi:hypothetical protein